MTTSTLTAQDVSRKTGYRLYGERYCSSLSELAEMELQGRSHYYDASNRRYFGCRVLSCHAICEGLVLVTVESVCHPEDGRLYRCVAFDLTGTIVHRSGDSESRGFKTAKSAHKEAAALSYDFATESVRVIEKELQSAKHRVDQLSQ